MANRFGLEASALLRLFSSSLPACSLLLVTATAHGAFTQATCPSGGYDTPFPVRFGSLEFDSLIDSSPIAYTNRQNYRWPLFANWNVQWLQTSVGPNFDAELNFDWFKVIMGGTTYTYTGQFTAGYSYYPWSLYTDSTYGHYVLNEWHTDASVTRSDQPYFDGARARCYSTVQATVPMQAIGTNKRYDGVLIKAGDVIYTSVYQPSGTGMRITVDVPDNASTSDADFDLYVSSTTSMPDDSNYTLRDFSSNRSAHLDLGTLTPGRWWYIGIHSYHGAGQFLLHAYNYQTSLTQKVCLNGISKSTGLTTGVTNTLKEASLWLLQATAGNYVFPSYNVVSIPLCNHYFCSDCDSTCDICMNNPAVNPDYCGPQTNGLGPPATTRIPYYTCAGYNDPVWTGLVFAHEFSHKNLALDDEYKESGPWCGHTILNGPYGNARQYCTNLNHCYDGTASPPPGCVSSNSEWNALSGFGFFPNPGSSNSADPGYWVVTNGSALATIAVN